jgi:hypothetical protein
LCEGCTNAGWLNFTGHFGSDKDSPAGPSHQGAWKNDGDNGYYYEMETLGTFGEDWGENRETTGIALGSLNDKQVIAVSRNKGDHARFAIYYWDNGLQVLALGAIAGETTGELLP